MKKQTQRKNLKLRKDTLHQLVEDKLEQAQGGYYGGTDDVICHSRTTN